MRYLITLLIIFFTAVNLSAQTVYITKTGTKYHSTDCRYLSQSKIAVDLDEAVNNGYGPCSVCRPVTKPKVKSTDERTGGYQLKDTIIKNPVVKQSIGSDQSVYITKSGTKYHRSGCTYLKSSMITISLKDALERGYGACSVCKPPK